MVETGSGSSYQQFVFTPDGNPYAIYNAGTSTLMKGTVPLPGGDTAIYNQSGLSYLRHTDWLGSSRLTTTWAHAVYSKTAYAPFGETYNEATGSGVSVADRSFTGQDQDVVSGSGGTGAYDFLFRKYDPSAGRWLSPDPYGWGAVDQTNPQSLNRYAYVTNGPLSLIDELGLCPQQYAVYSPSSTFYNGVYQGTTWTLQYTFWGDNGIPCGLPPVGCQYYINANGAYQGMQCNSGAYCTVNSCPTNQSPSNQQPTQQAPAKPTQQAPTKRPFLYVPTCQDFAHWGKADAVVAATAALAIKKLPFTAPLAGPVFEVFGTASVLENGIAWIGGCLW